MKIGTRKSLLAMVQTQMVAQAIKEKFPELAIEISGCETKGDLQQGRSLSDFGGKGAFTQDIENEILAGRLDLAVHSAKDMPMALPEGLVIGAVLKREDSRDVWVSCSQERLADLKANSVAGTGSQRRALQVRELNEGLMVKDIRGNVPTRLKKVSDGLYDGVILAAAGLKRLGYIQTDEAETGSFELEGIRYYYEYLPSAQFLPAAGQGIIAIEAREGDAGEVLAALNDEPTWLMLVAERAFLKEIGGSCNEAAAISSHMMKGHLVIQARYAGTGNQMRTAFGRKPLTDSHEENERIAETMGILAARRLLSQEEA
jgi:uroporphyrinogen III methyltransferase/synthase